MATVEIKIKRNTPVVWADIGGDYSDPTTGTVLAGTHQITLASLAASGGARQGAQADLGATMAARYAVLVGFEFDVAPAAGGVVNVYLAFSPSSVAGEANPGGVNGTDAAYTGTAGGTAANSVPQLLHAGGLVATPDAATVVQYQTIGVITPTERYVSSVVIDDANQAFEGDDVEMFIALIPLVDEAQEPV